MRFFIVCAVSLISLATQTAVQASISSQATDTHRSINASHKPPQSMSNRPIVIAHRGASGYRPEHTLAAYRLAIRMGADFIEPDLVATRDGVLIALHENELSGTTDIANKPEFADRRVTKDIDGVPTTGWFSEDFTLAEIKTLRARERIPQTRPRNTRFDGRYTIPTLGEVIDLVERESKRSGRSIGIYPETKHPTHFAKSGLRSDGAPIQISLSQILVDTLKEKKFTDPKRVFIQSFEIENLLRLKNIFMPKAGIDLPLVQLLGDIDNAFLPPASNFSQPYDVVYNASQGADMNSIYGQLNTLIENNLTTKTGYGELIDKFVLIWMQKNYATGIGPWKNSFLLRRSINQSAAANQTSQGSIQPIAPLSNRLTSIVHPFLADAIAAGLIVHPYTLRAEREFLVEHASGVEQSVVGEAMQMLSLGVNGFFIDQPDLGVVARDLFLEVNAPSH